MSDDITHDLDLLDDWLAGKGYGEEAGLVLRAMTLINDQARELLVLQKGNAEWRALQQETDGEVKKLRAALRPFAEADGNWGAITAHDLRATAAALKAFSQSTTSCRSAICPTAPAMPS